MDILFVGPIAVIAPDAADSRRLYVEALGLPLVAGEGSDYWHTEQLAGTKHFAIWPLREAAQACFGQPTWPHDRPVPDHRPVLRPIAPRPRPEYRRVARAAE